MIAFLLSGEGASDFGGAPGVSVEDVVGFDSFDPGPLALLLDSLVKEFGCSLLERDCVYFASRKSLKKDLDGVSPRIKLPAIKDGAREMLRYARMALFLARKARELEKDAGGSVVAVCFHDADPDSRQKDEPLWEKVANAMLLGFDHEEYSLGVPMVPQPISEAWLLCALKKTPYQDCAALERLSGSRRSPDNLKKRLGEALGRGGLNDRVLDGSVDHRKIDMPSFNAFRERLRDVLSGLLRR